MMHFSFLSPNTIAKIARGAVLLEQNYYYHSHGWCNHYCVRVAYPNGYGASIVFVSNSDDKKCWEIAIQKDGELWTDDDGLDYIWSDLTEEGVVETSDHIYFM